MKYQVFKMWFACNIPGKLSWTPSSGGFRKLWKCAGKPTSIKNEFKDISLVSDWSIINFSYVSSKMASTVELCYLKLEQRWTQVQDKVHTYSVRQCHCAFLLFSVFIFDFFHRDLFVVSSGSRNYFVIVKFVLEIVKLMKEIWSFSLITVQLWRFLWVYEEH